MEVKCMKGTIKKIIERNSASKELYKFGFISGTDNIDYYFDDYSFSNNDIDEFIEGDEVEFDVYNNTNKKNPKAINITSSDDLTNTTHFYRKGIVKHIRLNKKAVYSRFLKKGSGEAEILNKFSELLYVSKIGTFYMDKGYSYAYALLGTTELLKRYIRGQREFLLIFSHFDNKEWQDRTLKAEREIRRIKDVMDRNPIPNFYILISNADDFKDRIDSSVKGKPMSAIIPFSFHEIIDCDIDKFKDLVLNRFAEYYFENNLLGESNAIEEDNLLFGDRGKIADAIVERCRRGGNSGIFGLRRSGKTSVLNATLRRLDKENIKYIKIESRSDLQDFKSWQSALYYISRKVRAEVTGIVQNEEETHQDYIKRLNLNRSFDEFSENASQSFVEDVKLYCRNEDLFVIAIDEIELITYNTASSTTWKNIESYCGFWSALRDCGCSLIICGVNSTINEISTISYNGDTGDNPMYERITNCSESYKTYLPSFTDEQTKKMINTLGGYSDIGFTNVYSQINKTFGGQPYAIRQFCAFVFDQVKSMRNHIDVYEVSKATVDNLLIQFNSSIHGKGLYQTILQHVQTYYREEYDMLKTFALNSQGTISIKSENIQSVDHLEKYGLIEFDHGTQFVTFRIDSIKKFICENNSKRPETMDNEERRRFVQDFVANFEKKLKGHIYNYYNICGKEADGKRIIQSYVKNTSSFTGNIASSKFEELFDHQKFVLYFSDLRKIIADNWSSLGSKFVSKGIDKNRFEICMKDLNAGRTDADHYDAEDLDSRPYKWEIDDNTMQRFCAAKQELEKFF